MDKIIQDNGFLLIACDIPDESKNEEEKQKLIQIIFRIFVIIWQAKEIGELIGINNPIKDLLKGSEKEIDFVIKLHNKFKIINFNNEDYTKKTWYPNIKYTFKIPNLEPYYLVLI